jgi:hypothetical protein
MPTRLGLRSQAPIVPSKRMSRLRAVGNSKHLADEGSRPRPALSARPLTVARNEIDAAAEPVSRKARSATMPACLPTDLLMAPSRAAVASTGAARSPAPALAKPLPAPASEAACQHQRQLARSSKHTPRPRAPTLLPQRGRCVCKDVVVAATAPRSIQRVRLLPRSSQHSTARGPRAIQAPRSPSSSRRAARPQHRRAARRRRRNVLASSTCFAGPAAHAQRTVHALPARRAAQPRRAQRTSVEPLRLLAADLASASKCAQQQPLRIGFAAATAVAAAAFATGAAAPAPPPQHSTKGHPMASCARDKKEQQPQR